MLHDAAPVLCIGMAPGDAAASDADGSEAEGSGADASGADASGADALALPDAHALLDGPAAPRRAGRGRARPRPARGPVAVVYTSGSTGTRKGALIGGGALLHAFWPGNGALGLSAPIRCLIDLPVDHLGGLVERVLPPLLSGGAVVLHERFDAGAFLRDAARHRVTYLHGEVTQWLRCVALDAFDDADLSAVEVALYTGAAAPAALLERLAARFPRVATGYGLTETCGPVTLAGAIGPGAPAGLVGTPIRGVELRVVDDRQHPVPTGTEGRIRVRGHTLTPGYLGRPDATRALIDADGWLETGDRGALLPGGALRLAGRSSDMYKSGGHNVYPREVETVLEAHAGVAHAAVVGVPDPLFQEVGAAFVVARPESRLDAGLAAFCRERLAPYKVPKAFHVVPDLPLLEIGKVDRRALRRRHDEGTAHHPDHKRSTR